MSALVARQSDDSGESAKSASISGMLAVLAPAAVVAGIYLVCFLILRMYSKRFYAPRTYLGSLPESERTPSLPNGLFNWIGKFWKIPDSHALRYQSIDSYLFLRFLRVCTLICFVGLLITWPTLFPISITGGGDQKQLNVLSMSNIDTSTKQGGYRLFGPVLVACIFYGFVLFLVLRECIFYINLRQAYLLAPQNARRISSRTVLFTCVPEDYLDETRFRNIFRHTAKRVWIAGDTDKLDELVDNRDKAAMRLENAEVKLIKLANKARVKATGGTEGSAAPDGKTTSQDTETGDIAARWVPADKRPTHRLGKFGLYGEKVDSIEWARGELATAIPAVEEAQAEYRSGKYKKVGAVFVEFLTQSDAESAVQSLTHHEALNMSPRYIGIRPDEVIWSNLKMPWWQRITRRYAVLAFITVLVLFWAIPVAFVGAISQIDSLIARLPWLSFLNKIPPVIMGVVSGLLPSVLLSILMSLVPIIIRALARFSGEPSESRVELFTQNGYFVFQVVQVFLVTTIASSATSIVGNWKHYSELYSDLASNPTQIFSLLSSSIPQSSNFYVSYFILQGVGISSSVISQVAGFAIFMLLYTFLAGTPRSKYTKWTSLSAMSWGSVMPVYTNIAVISITYSVIAPLMLFWSTIGIGLFYLAYRYNILFVSETQVDTRGLIYPRALKQLLTGVYLAEICLIGMCIVSRAYGPVVIAVVLLVFTILYHITLQKALDPLLYNLPRNLQAEEEMLMESRAAGVADDGDAELGVSSARKEGSPAADAESGRKANMFAKFFKPWKYVSYYHMRKLVPRSDLDVDNMYEEATEANSYFPPSVRSKIPLLWIPRDAGGVSRQEVRESSKVVPITDEGCSLDEKSKLVWDTEGARPPIWEEKILY